MLDRKRIAFFVLGNALVAALCGGITAFWMVKKTLKAAPGQTTAQEFLLVDEAGHIGARLGWQDRQPGLWLFDRANIKRSALFLEPNGVPDLYLYDQNKTVRAALNLFDSGVPNLAFIDAANQHMVWTAYDDKLSYNLTFLKFSKTSMDVIATRHFSADENGVHQNDARGKNERR